MGIIPLEIRAVSYTHLYQEYVRGWVEYFRLADMKELLRKTDEWARRRIRAVYWKQWKKIKTKYRMLKALGLEDWKAKELANSCLLYTSNISHSHQFAIHSQVLMQNQIEYWNLFE